jgi:hypothetical protein
MFKTYMKWTELTDKNHVAIVHYPQFRKILSTYAKNDVAVSFKRLRSDVCDCCMFLRACISTCHDALARKHLEQLLKDHEERATGGYEVVQALYAVANLPSCPIALFEYDFLKTMVYPIVNEEPTFKYRATHKSLHIFGVHNPNTNASTLFHWDSQEGRKVCSLYSQSLSCL